MSPLFGDTSFLVVKLRFRQQVNSVATDHCFPIEAVIFIQDFFGWFRPAIHFCRCAKQRVDFFDVSILTCFVIGDDNGRIASLLAVRKHDDVPLLHFLNYSRSLGARTTEALARRFSSWISALL